MDAGLGLPKRFLLTLLSLLALSTVCWFINVSAANRWLIACFSLIFIFSTLHGALLIRMGKFDVYKNVLNAILNIYTACAFIYGLHNMFDYSASGPKNPEAIVRMAMTETSLIVPVITFLVVACIVRASFSVAEIFKTPIIQSRKHRAEYQQNIAAE